MGKWEMQYIYIYTEEYHTIYTEAELRRGTNVHSYCTFYERNATWQMKTITTIEWSELEFISFRCLQYYFFSVWCEWGSRCICWALLLDLYESFVWEVGIGDTISGVEQVFVFNFQVKLRI